MVNIRTKKGNKTMKSVRFFAMFVFMAFATGGFADYLVYWTVNNATDMYTEDPIEFDYATISAVDSSSPDNPITLYQYDNDMQKTPAYEIAPSESDQTSFQTPAYSGPVSPVDWSSIDYFFVRLWSDLDSSNPLGWERYAKSDVESSIWNTEATGSQTTIPFTVSRVVPEPTSALLMLLGMAGLALRRRHA